MISEPGEERSTLLLGGARSGKSTLAARLAGSAGSAVTVVVTADERTAAATGDDELLDRIARHRIDRPAAWPVVEAGSNLAATVGALAGPVVIDCVTMWLAGLGCDGSWDARFVESAVDDLIEVVDARADRTVLVSNEVGSGVVPVSGSGREFRDVQGRVNQRLARACDRAVLVVAGLVLPLRRPEQMFEEIR